VKTVSLIASIVVVSIAFSPRVAEARFGKKTPSTEEQKPEEQPPVPTPPPPPVHVATPAVHRAEPVCDAPVVVGYRPRPVYYEPARTVVVQPQPRQEGGALRRFELIGTAQAVQDGGSVGVRLLVDGRRAGFVGGYDLIVVGTDDGTRGVDAIQLLGGQITAALLDGRDGRLRRTGGVPAAFAPDIALVGPTLGASATLNLVGPFVLDAQLAVTPFPFTGVDARAGLGLELGPVQLSAGYRCTYLNDQGRVDGIAHGDTFAGPYMGLGLVF
jgi:hypothetical protein